MRFLWRLIAITTFTLLSCAAAAQQYPALVATYAEHRGGNVVYHYEVRNTSSAEIRRIFVGCDCRSIPGAIPELTALPVAATLDREDDWGIYFAVEPEAVQQPTGWRARVVRPHGESGHWVEWYMPAARAGAGITNGQRLAGFSITIPGADEGHLTGRYTLEANDGRIVTSGSLALLDTTPPTLSLQTGAIAEGAGTTAIVRVVPTAKDDRDPEPRIAIESFTRVEDAARPEYLVVYSATDASGNRSTATTRVAAPPGPPPAPPAVEPPSPGPADPARFRLPRLAFLP